MSRFVVTELEGYTNTVRYPGLSVHVIDTAVNHRLVATYRTEDVNGRIRRDGMRAFVRESARAKAAELNAALA